MICEHCKIDNIETAKYCRVCGAPLNIPHNNVYIIILFCVFVVLFAISLTCIAFPTKYTEFPKWFNSVDGYFVDIECIHVFYIDPLSLMRIEGSVQYSLIWFPIVVCFGATTTVLFYSAYKRIKKRSVFIMILGLYLTVCLYGVYAVLTFSGCF